MKNILKLFVLGLFLISCSNTNKFETKDTINQIITLEKDSFIYHGEKDVTFERFTMGFVYGGNYIEKLTYGNKLSDEMIYSLDSLIKDSTTVFFYDFIINSDTLKTTEGNLFDLKLIKGVDF